MTVCDLENSGFVIFSSWSAKCDPFRVRFPPLQRSIWLRGFAISLQLKVVKGDSNAGD
jgi:hypothetical protein